MDDLATKVVHMKTKPQAAVALPAVQPMFVDIHAASAALGLSVFAVRTICWNKLLRPVRHGKKYLFTLQMLTELRDKLVSGQVTLPVSPVKPSRRAA